MAKRKPRPTKEQTAQEPIALPVREEATLARRETLGGAARGVLPPSDRLVFVYGLQSRSNEVNIFTVAPAIQAFASLIIEANRTLHPEAPPIEIKVRPFRKGSLLTDLVLSSPAWGPLMVEYGHTAAPYIHSILEKLGLVKSTVNGVIKVMEFLKKPPKTVENMGADTYRYFSDDHRRHIDVNAPVHTLIQNTTIHNHMYNAVAAPIEKGDATAVVLKPKGARKGQVKIGKPQVAAIKEFKKRKDLPRAENEVTNETTVFLQPKRGSFDAEGKNWSFHKGKEVITANIKDDVFLDRYRKGEFRIHHTDILKVHLVEHQKVKNGKLQTTHDIVDVIDYQPGEHQPRLRAQNE